MTSTGYTTTNFEYWPVVAKTVIILLMICGAMAGSTGGGIKVSRIVLAFKGVKRNILHLINPRMVTKTKFEGKLVDDETINDVFSFITLYFVIAFLIILALSFDKSPGVVIDGVVFQGPVHQPTQGNARWVAQTQQRQGCGQKAGEQSPQGKFEIFFLISEYNRFIFV